jgi:hypothetical protein
MFQVSQLFKCIPSRRESGHCENGGELDSGAVILNIGGVASDPIVNIGLSEWMLRKECAELSGVDDGQRRLLHRFRPLFAVLVGG